ncbi:flagellar biosynthetic protein FliO [Micavibrio aeruginosavorus]|uniref:Flagellar assembly protein FliO n=1 Tax=Micavibrio aeruginosavorus EPB TaxID=349215 RepID=M4VGD0_9BACT|nr:flagellar biosynthetic protein FliO [Micavibrio aeruginosavorus]AGH98432.1 hypothetical protein A11S_1628 [Micavibrio aeruginosavorus EPB]
MTDFVRFAAALIFVLALMGGLSLVMRRINAGRLPMTGASRQMRVVEVLSLDARRRAILLRRGHGDDARQHLIILGPNGETIVETGIVTRDDTDKNG